MEKIRIVIVDDHQLICDGLSRIIQEIPEFEVITTYQNPIEALQKIPVWKPDILLVDFEMPGLNGLELIQKLKLEIPDLRSILLTMHLDKATVKEALSQGVNAYILKNLDEFELRIALEKVRNDQNYYSAPVTEVLNDKYKVIQKNSNSQLESLSNREREVLRLIAEAFSTKEIAHQLSVEISTIETHRKSLLRKLDVRNVAGLVRIAIQEGLVT
ncbi:response regulator [Algoriphagus zhangzhouensis]|uniref:Two component transcriptional regulator, LuxR family n=1 Tax=Algoriphagus zhangzhouensis TaxID=1073327 RepID=A0A1M7ZC23_9BACT|nr:response regulator transcription factor [Algoriphagus zhangzhouensis]TDY45489.1 LuxR family two component transcriptional regulator [Algoriphagus zhangzhouensis]SHO62448.1 two component transcriptional regulator, LuxR family [Algoriphagus zhangzhouensis]